MRRILPISFRHKPFGVSLVEVVVVITIVGVVLPIFLTLLVNAYKDTFSTDDKIKANTEITQALWYIDDTVRNSKDFLTAVPSAYSDPYGPHDAGTSGAEAWSYKGDSATSRVLIIENYSTTTNSLNTGRQPVFINTGEFNCTTEMYYQPQLTYISIFFVKDSTLYRRILTDTNTSLCSGNTQAQKQTCQPSIPVVSRHASCLANDEVLANNVSNFAVEYYQISVDGTSSAIDPTYASTDPEILEAADYANVTITASARENGVQTTLTQRMTKVN